MALEVEDGTGKSTADAYISVTDADGYHSARNNTAWADLSTAQKEAAILYATAWIDSRYTWRGTIVEEDQALGLPTEDGEDDQGREITGLPLKVAHATAELALIHSATPLNATLGPQVVEQEVVGAVKRRFSERYGNEGYRYPIIDKLLKGLHYGGQFQVLESMGS
jgi:hypothetical protein